MNFTPELYYAQTGQTQIDKLMDLIRKIETTIKVNTIFPEIFYGTSSSLILIFLFYKHFSIIQNHQHQHLKIIQPMMRSLIESLINVVPRNVLFYHINIHLIKYVNTINVIIVLV